MALVAHWNYSYRGGFAWDGSIKQFNWHPVFMVTGMVVLYGNGTIDFSFIMVCVSCYCSCNMITLQCKVNML